MRGVAESADIVFDVCRAVDRLREDAYQVRDSVPSFTAADLLEHGVLLRNAIGILLSELEPLAVALNALDDRLVARLDRLGATLQQGNDRAGLAGRK